MKTLLFGVAFAFACLSIAHARIGETLDECTQRYGEPFVPAKPGETVMFRKGEFFLRVSFYEGRADLIAFVKIGDALPKLPLSPQPMTDTEISKLLEANSHGLAWTATESLPRFRNWTTTDHRLVAYYGSNALVISTKAAFDRANADDKRKEEKKLEGF